MPAEEFIPFFSRAYCYFIDINNDWRFPATYGVHRGSAFVTLRDAAAARHIGRHAPA
jgi:hypothetical protein